MCDLFGLYIINGIHSPAAYTCHTGRGESTVDYILSNKHFLQINHTNLQPHNFTDHDLLYTTIPITPLARTPLTAGLPTMDATSPTSASAGPPGSERVGHPRTMPPADDKHPSVKSKSYRWVAGACLKEYGNSAAQWKAHTSTTQFAAAFTAITTKSEYSNEGCTEKLEAFLLEEALAAGVIEVATRRTAKNPNKWAKHMAPWYTTQCKAARARYRAAVKHNGREHAHAVDAFKALVH
jgi:hypothetical protein